MQQVVAAVSRRKKVLALAAVIAAGSYASYTYYKSDSFQRRKKQVVLLVHGLGKLLETVANVSESAALVTGDLNGFVRSDGNEVPQSIKQLFKILRCAEFQDFVVVSSSRICKEVILGVAPTEVEPKVRNSSVATSESDGWRTVEFEADKVFLRSGGSSRRSSSRSRRQEGVPERLLNKLFSEAGKGFASVVVGAAVRNLVVTFFEELQRQSEAGEFGSRDLVPQTYELGASGVVRAPVRVETTATPGWKPEALLDLACSSQGKTLIAECIQQFVEASVSTYLEKTRDINVFEEMVEAVTHPVHQVPAKEMIVTVCNEAVDTFVRTSYEVLHDGPSASSRPREHAAVAKTSTSEPGSSLQQTSSENMVEKLLRAMSAPTNRTLVMDLAGKVTSEAVHSFFNVVIAICRPYVRSSQHVVQSKVVVVKNRLTGDAAAKVLVLMTVCFAVILHVLANSSGAK